MMEQNSPDLAAAPKGPGGALYFLLAALLAAGLYLALIYPGHKPRPALNSQAASGAAAGAPAAQFPPAAQTISAPAMRPLGRSLEDISEHHTNKIKSSWTEPILSGPLEGGSVRKFLTGSGTDDLYILNGAVYRRAMSFRLAEMLESVEGTHANFSGLVFIYGLYPSAFDEDSVSGKIPPELQKLADAYGAKCGALAEPGARPAEHRELHDGYVFYCSNKDTTRLIYGVCSEGLLAAETAGKK